jgi:hypothetical protein
MMGMTGNMKPKFQVKYRVVMKWPSDRNGCSDELYDTIDEAMVERNRVWTGIACPADVRSVLVCELDGIKFEITDKVIHN